MGGVGGPAHGADNPAHGGGLRGGAAAIVSADSSHTERVQAWLDSARARPLLTRPTKVLYRVDIDSTA